MSNDNLPGACSVRQEMYMFPEKYAKDIDGNKLDIDHIDVVLFGGAAGCFDADTEYLTPTGWKKISDYVGGDLVAQWDSLSDEVSFIHPERYVKEPCSLLYRIKTQGLDFVLSEEHTVVYFENNSIDSLKTIPFIELLHKHNSSSKGFEGNIKTTFKVNHSGLDLSDSELIDKFNREQFDKDLWGCSNEQLGIIVKSLNTLTHKTECRDRSDFVQYAFHSQGYNTTFIHDDMYNCFMLNASSIGGGYRSLISKRGKASIMAYSPLDDYRYCFTVDTGFLVVRREGKVFITGNSGKSEIGVIDFLKHLDAPNFIGVMTRRTTPQLTGPGGLLSKCKRVFSQSFTPEEYTWRAKDGKFVFHNSGAEVYLKHFENDQADVNWQGAEANLFYVDEATQFTQHMIQYIMSRMRNPSCPQVPPHLRMTCNPDADHFLKDWVLPYLKEDGTPDRSKDGLVRYFSFHDGEFAWGYSKQELKDKYDINPEDALSFMFISANVYDNPIIQKVNPKYTNWLKGLKGVERKRLLEGNWLVREEAAGLFKRLWLEEVSHVDESEVLLTVRAFDFAATLKSDLQPSPDYTASVRIRKMKNGDYIIDDVVRHRVRVGDWERFVLECASKDPSSTEYIIPQDPGAAAAKATREFVRELIANGLYIRKTKVTNNSKLNRFRPFASASQNGFIKILSNCGTDLENGKFNELEFYYKEMEAFTGVRKRGESGHDDMVDATSDGFLALATKTTSLSGISKGLANMTKQFNTGNPFK